MELGLRHQGALVAAVRGADGVAKDDPIKLLTRSFRSAVLISFDTKPSAFIDYVPIPEVKERMASVAKDTDSYNWHFLSHFLYGSEIIGYYHPDTETRESWNWFYHYVVKKMHLHPETKEELDDRLGMDEERFEHHEEPGGGIPGHRRDEQGDGAVIAGEEANRIYE